MAKDNLEDKIKELIEVDKELARQIKELKKLVVGSSEKVGYVV